MKSERQSEILKIIKAGDVETQEQLLTMLRNAAIGPLRPRFPGTLWSCVW